MELIRRQPVGQCNPARGAAGDESSDVIGTNEVVARRSARAVGISNCQLGRTLQLPIDSTVDQQYQEKSQPPAAREPALPCPGNAQQACKEQRRCQYHSLLTNQEHRHKDQPGNEIQPTTTGAASIGCGVQKQSRRGRKQASEQDILPDDPDVQEYHWIQDRQDQQQCPYHTSAARRSLGHSDARKCQGHSAVSHRDTSQHKQSGRLRTASHPAQGCGHEGRRPRHR